MKIFCNSQGTQSRDPSVIKHNGKYYWTYAYENKLYIMEADTVDGLLTVKVSLCGLLTRKNILARFGRQNCT